MGDRGGVTVSQEDANEPADVCALPPTASPRKCHPYSHGVVVFLVSIPAWWLGEGERILRAGEEEAGAESGGGGANTWLLGSVTKRLLYIPVVRSPVFSPSSTR
jgi:hypothetical protein